MPENTEREFGPHPAVTIRQTRHAVHILLTGAMHTIDRHSPNGDTAKSFQRHLLEGVQEELAGWDLDT